MTKKVLTRRYRYLATPEAVELFCAIQSGDTEGLWEPVTAPPAAYDLEILGLLVTTEDEAEFLNKWGIAATSYQAIREQIGALLSSASDTVRVYVDSPGGYVAGIEKVIRRMETLKNHKQIHVYSDGMIASAAYWIASVSNKITTSSMAQIGSVGVYTTLTDYSKMDERMGIKTHLISSGKHKGSGEAGTEITEETLKEEQRIIDAIASKFFASVTRYRHVNERYKDGGIYLAEDAQKMGLIEEINDDEELDVTQPENEKGVTKMTAQNTQPVALEDENTTTEPVATEEEHSEDGHIEAANVAQEDAPQAAEAPVEEVTEDAPATAPADSEAVAAEAVAEAIAQEKARCLALLDAFSFDAAFTRRMVEEDASVDAAKVAAYDAGLRAQEPVGTDRLDNTINGATDNVDNNCHPILAQAKAKVAAEKIPLYKAMEQIAKQNPEGYAAYFHDER